MDKFSDNSSQNSKKTGFLSKSIKKGIMQDRLAPDIKYKLTNSRNGKLTQVLKAVVDDFKLLTRERNSKILLDNYKVHEQLTLLNSILENFLSNTFTPEFRISATVKKGTKQRVFKLSKINYSGKDDLAIIRSDEFFRGLKKNEINFIQKYIKNKSRNFPLEFEKLYTWLEVKEILTHEMKKIPEPTDEEKEIVRKRMKMARAMIEKNIDVEKIRKETGCNFKVIYEGEPKLNKK